MDLNKVARQIVSSTVGMTVPVMVNYIESRLSEVFAAGKDSGASGEHEFAGKSFKITLTGGGVLNNITVDQVVQVGGEQYLYYEDGGTSYYLNIAQVEKLEVL